ncbi:MAG: TOBE domain-containing protein [Chloroflexota bacterium]
MIDGRIQQVGTPEEVFSSPINETVAAFVGVENIIAGTVWQQLDGLAILRVREGEIATVGEYAAGETMIACIRPEDVVLETYHAEAVLSSARNRLSGHVTRCVPLGAQYRVMVDCGFPLVSLITRRSVEDLALTEGVAVIASFKASAVHMIRRRVG